MDKMDNQSSDDEKSTNNRTSKPDWGWIAAFLAAALFSLVTMLIIGLLNGYSNIKFYSSNPATIGDKEKPEESGIEFYPPKPYLMVEKKFIKDPENSKGSKESIIELKTNIIYLPDLTKPQYAKPKTGFFGPDEWAINFSNGMLTSVGAQSSSKIMMPDIPELQSPNWDISPTSESQQATQSYKITRSSFEFYEIINSEGTIILQRVKLIP